MTVLAQNVDTNQRVKVSLLHCPAYVAQRQALFHGHIQVYPFRSLTNNASTKNQITLTELIVHGSSNDSLDRQAFPIIQVFISNSNRLR